MKLPARFLPLAVLVLAQSCRKFLILTAWSTVLRVFCLPGLLLATANGGGVAEPVSSQGQAPAPDSDAGVFSGNLTASFFAVQADALLKVPAAVLADPTRLLGFLTHASKDGKTYQLVSAAIAIQSGAGVWKDVKPRIYATDFRWQGDEVVPGASKSSLNVGSSIDVSAATQESGMVKFTYSFEWVPEPAIRPIPGFGREYAWVQLQRRISCGTSATVTRGETTLAAEWRSDITPPGAEPGSSWQYFLFHTLQ